MSKLFNWLKPKQKKSGNQSASSEMKKEGYVSPGPATPSSELLPLSCKNLLLPPFIDAYCNDNLLPLFSLITGTDEEKLWRWKVILEEYSWLMKNEDGDNLFGIAKQIYILKTHIAAVDWCVYYLQNIQFDKEISAKLCEVYPMDYSIKANVQRALTMVDTKRYELEVLADEYERLRGDSGGDRMKEEDFNKIIYRISKYQGFKFDKFSSTVADFATAYQEFISDNKNSD